MNDLRTRYTTASCYGSLLKAFHLGGACPRCVEEVLVGGLGKAFVEDVHDVFDQGLLASVLAFVICLRRAAHPAGSN
jgi:hypothetical protein